MQAIYVNNLIPSLQLSYGYCLKAANQSRSFFPNSVCLKAQILRQMNKIPTHTLQSPTEQKSSISFASVFMYLLTDIIIYFLSLS